LVKLYTAKQAVSGASEILESFGGAGYVEDTGLPRLLRDSQVLSIWEGTTNVLSLDVLRAIEKENVGEPFLKDMRSRMHRISSRELAPLVVLVSKAIQELESCLSEMSSFSDEKRQTGARQLSLSLARTYMASLLVENADDLLKISKDQRGWASAARWCRRDLVTLLSAADDSLEESKVILNSSSV
jgi:hypothetical protein